MATSKKSAKTSKTAHVLNVITGAQASSEAADDGVDSPAAHVPVPPVLEVARANDDALSEAILDALTEELEEDDAPVSASEPVPPASSVRTQSLEKSAPAEPEEAADAAPAETDQPEPAVPNNPPQNAQKYYNVTQALVEDKTLKYMKMMGMCTCPRCQADVKALALSNLPPKYIVMQPSQITPMFSVYEGKYGAAVTAQLISACRVVLESPRH